MSLLWQHQLALALFVLGTHSHPTLNDRDTAPTTLNFGVIGDSWASGVTYGIGGSTNYDDNSSGCMRINHAYAVQLQSDMKSGQYPGASLSFAACSGSRLWDMKFGKMQLDQLKPDTHFLTMQAGGNNAGFYTVARDCIYHNEDKEYGEQYPGPGECSNSIAASERYINPGILDPPGIYHDMRATINDVLAHKNTQQPDFKLYVLGYAHFFNENSPDSDWCNDSSFSVSVGELLNNKRVKLTWDVRHKINDLTTTLNDKIAAVIKDMNSDKVEYLSITEGFDKHRFCEAGSSLWRQYFDSNVWLWNTSPALLFTAQDSTDQAHENSTWSAAYNVSQPQPSDLAAWNWVDLLQMEKGTSATSPEVNGYPDQNGSPGSALRPFHPKADGHGSIKDVILAAVKIDFPTSHPTWASPENPIPAGDCSLLLQETNITSATANVAFEGAFGYPDGGNAGNGRVEAELGHAVKFPTELPSPVTLTPYLPPANNQHAGVTFTYASRTFDSSDSICTTSDWSYLASPPARSIQCRWNCH